MLEEVLDEIRKAEKLFEEGEVKDFVKRAKVLSRKGTILSKQEKYMIEKQILWKTSRKCHSITHEDRLNYLPVYDRDKEEYLKEYPDKYNMILFIIGFIARFIKS